MQSWIFYGILTSLLWGSYIIAAKIATSEKYYGLNPHHASLFMLVGIAIGFLFFVGYSFSQGNFQVLPQTTQGILFAVLAGLLWALGMVASLRALFIGADVAKLTPLYNTNTLVTVLLGIILLHELPSTSETIRVVVGAVLVVVGAILVSF